MSCFCVLYMYKGCTSGVFKLQCLIPDGDGTKVDGTMCPKKLHVGGIWGSNFGYMGEKVDEKIGMLQALDREFG